jgi:hypothetical protein
VLLFRSSIVDTVAHQNAERLGEPRRRAAVILGSLALDLVVASVIAITGLLLSTDVGSLMILWVLESCTQW